MQEIDDFTSRFLTDRQAAQLLNISVGTIRRWRQFGQGPRWVKLASSIRYAFADLQEWLASAPSGGAVNDRQET